MLTERITKRFLKHHTRLMAYMDATEALAHQMVTSGTPQKDFENGRKLLDEFLLFMVDHEVQHEKEEEQILLPVLAQRMTESKKAPPKLSMEQMCREHAVGIRLVEEVQQEITRLDQVRGDVKQERYYRLAEALQDVVWHYRRHVSLENSIILPVAERLIPDNQDELWVRDDPIPECPDA